MNLNLRKVFVIGILAFCIVVINLAVFFTITEKSNDVNQKENEQTNIDIIALSENFNNIFDNTINYQGNTLNVNKKDNSKDIIYTSYSNSENKENIYELNVSIPYLNMNSSSAERINQEINNLFYNKAMNIVSNTNNTNTVYSVKYKAYINDNILSLVISATLKEGTNAQRLMIKTYNYNISSNEEIAIEKVLEYRQLSSQYIQNKIIETIKSASENVNIYNELGYSKYVRDINDDIYKVENTSTFFIGENKALYIIYPYGNSNYTTEFDLLVI